MATITRFDPFRNVSGMQDEMQRLVREVLGSDVMPSTAGAFSPALDVEETEDGFTLHVELPGVSADDVEITLEENVLTIAGERPFYGEERADDFRRVERRFGRFHRAIRMPDRVAGDLVAATFRDGMLTISVPKAEEAKPRRIEVKTG